MKQRMSALAIVTAAGASCATIFTGSDGTVSINSEPQDAKVTVSGNYMGNTPLKISLKRDKDYNLTLKKEGYAPATAVVTRSFNAVSILNLFGVLCWVVDILTGAMWKFEPDQITVMLEKTSHPSAGQLVPGRGLVSVPYEGKMALVLPRQLQ